MNRWPATLIVAALAWGGLFLGASAEAGGGRAIRLEWIGAGGAPFSAVELGAAVELRAPLAPEGGEAVAVSVASPEPGWIEVACEGRRRRIDLRGTAGPDAARLVALIVVDLVRADVPLPSAAAPPPAPKAAAVAVAPALAPAPARSRWVVAGVVGFGVRTTDAGPGIAPELELRRSFGERARVMLIGGFERAEVSVSGSRAGTALALNTFPIRAGGGWRIGWAEVRAGVLMRPYVLSGLDSASGIVWGGFAAVAGELPARGPVAAFGVVGLDLVPQPLAFAVADQRLLTMRTLAPFVGVGAIWRGRGG